ncbi:hypothetical protein ACUNV4_18040 [Granulosicoccus sp. 3-233]|uniref:hypothetical protein n=1 Tax=Granulosicoccus sp. 3-233 TaxID=3417969 RepID=UPI003D32FAE6
MPLSPLIAGFLALDLINGPIPGSGASDADVSNYLAINSQLPGLPTFYQDDLDMRFFPGLVTFISFGLFHLFACMTVFAMMMVQAFHLPSKARQQALLILAGIITLLIAVNLIARVPSLMGALTLTYRNICSVLVAGDVVSHLLPGSCTEKGISAFAWLALLPYLFGLLAAASAAAVTSVATRPIVASDDIQQELERRAHQLEQASRGTAFVLVTSVITMMLFYQLPVSLIQEPHALALMSHYSNSLSLFWGVIFTLTLVAIFAPASWMIRQQLRELQVDASLPETLLSDTTRERLLTALGALAPLLVGASGSIIEKLTATL